ncbi:MAG: hypothetical protein B6D39_05570 [Anaerolineae bacterium UTCFX2]|jgi:hypothetical protein|nr:hypothetical protein [Anaerolineae bacterium]MCZ7552368.1 hypothetical protein [Anaerolineales bacterium]OQY91836.1 MAG: hypothetical protein B6D39_05570 [Anaerolineae bacterium UTCFX2]
MAKQKFDGVIDAVHYNPDGQVQWVRAYLRRGAIFTDNLLIQRQDLIEEIRSGKKFFAGKRIPLMASTFEINAPVRLVESNENPILLVGERDAQQDRLENVPVI